MDFQKYAFDILLSALKDTFKNLAASKTLPQEKKVEILALTRKCYFRTQDYLKSINKKEDKDLLIYNEILNDWTKLSANIQLINSDLGDNITLIINEFREVHNNSFYDKDRFANELEEIFSKLEGVIQIKSEEEINKRRRQLIKLIGLSLVSGIPLVMSGDTPKEPTIVTSRIALGNREDYQEIQRELLRELFGFRGTSCYASGESHEEHFGEIHPDDKTASGCIRGFFNPSEKRGNLSVDPSSNLYCLGSPKSNRFSRSLMEYIEHPNGTMVRSPNPYLEHKISYNFPPKKSENPVANRWIGNKLCSRALYSFNINTKEGSKTYETRVDKDGWLQNDFLIISRLPNLRNIDTINYDKEIIVFGGLHGIGTKAIELLFNDVNLLELMIEERDKNAYYQSVFEVTKIKHKDSDKISFPQTIVHRHTVPIETDKNRLKSLIIG